MAPTSSLSKERTPRSPPLSRGGTIASKAPISDEDYKVIEWKNGKRVKHTLENEERVLVIAEDVARLVGAGLALSPRCDAEIANELHDVRQHLTSSHNYQHVERRIGAQPVITSAGNREAASAKKDKAEWWTTGEAKTRKQSTTLFISVR